MKPELKDYIHLYGFCDCVVLKGMGMTHKTKIIGMHENGSIQVAHPIGDKDYFNVQDIRLLLTPMECDFTQEELSGWEKVATPVGEMHIGSAMQIHWNKRMNYYRSIGRDVDQLIEAGLAFDKTKF